MKFVPSYILAALVLLTAIAQPSEAQWMGKQTGCYPDSLTANPNRPTVANPADITQYGVLELEYGFDRVWNGGDERETSFGGLLKFGLLCDVELRWNTTSFLWQTDGNSQRSGVGDNWLGSQVRIRKQTQRAPTLAFSYSLKFPSASADAGLGTKPVDHAFSFLASKDIKGVHFDFNATHFWIGRENVSGYDGNYQINLAFSDHIYRGLQFTGEFYGNTTLNRETPGFASSLWALTYTINPRLVIDSGLEVGLTSGAPEKHLFLGFTYSIVELYPGWRKRTRSSD
jgi:Putative MetA-pathway of phenol degradation